MGQPTSNSDTYLINAVQCAHLLHEIRRKSTMGTIFHVANYAHWKEMKTERLSLPVELQLKDLVSHSILAMSGKLILQMLRATESNQNSGLAHLHATADAELEALLSAHKKMVDEESRVLTALDGIDIFSVCIYMVDRHVRNAGPARLHTNPTVRTCLTLCSAISERFSGMKQMLEMLWLFIDLASSNSSDVEADMLRLMQQHQTSGTSLPGNSLGQMRSVLMRRSESCHASANLLRN